MPIEALFPVVGELGFVLSAVATHRLVRIDVVNLQLAPGEGVEFEITVSKRRLPCQRFRCDDPAPRGGLTFSLAARAQPGERFTVTAVCETSPRDKLEQASYAAVYSLTPWSQYLPAVFREDSAQAEFLDDFLAQLFDDGERIEATLDSLSDYVAPARLPSLAAARFLAGWFDIDLDLVLSPVSIDLQLQKARRFLSRALPLMLAAGTAASVTEWIDAVAEARDMSIERRRDLALVEGFKLRRFFSLASTQDAKETQRSAVGAHFGWLPGSGPLANDPLARRAFLGRSRLSDAPTLGMSRERDDPTLLANLLGAQLWLFTPRPINAEPRRRQWRELLAPMLPAHLELVVSYLPSSPPPLGYSSVLGLGTRL